VALVLSLTALALRLILAPFLQLDVPFLTFLGAVILSAWYGGTGPALLAVALSSLLANYCCVPPFHELSFDRIGVTSMVLFDVEAVGLVWLMSILRRRAALLEASQTKLELFKNSITDAYAVVDANWIYTEINDKAESIFGAPKEQFLGRNIWHCFPEHVGSSLWQEMHRAMASRTPVQFETYSNRAHRWFESRVYPHADGLAVLFTDISDRKAAEATARRAEEQLQLVTDAVPALIAYVDTNLRFVTCNDAYRTWFGLSKHDVIGKTLADVVGDDAWGRIRPYVEQALTGVTVDYEMEMPYRHGPARWIRAVYTPHRDKDGHLAGFVAMVTNITEQKTIERAMRESEERFRLATAAGDVGIWDWDIRANRVSWSDTIYRIYGLRSGDFPGTVEAFTALVHPNDLAVVEDAIRRALNDLASYDLEFRAIRPDGKIVWISTKAQVVRDGSGLPSRMLGASVDITERKAAEEAIRKSEQHFREMADAAPAMLWVTDNLHETIFISRGWREYTQQEKDAGLGFGWTDAVHPDDRADATEIFLDAAARRESFALQYRLRRYDGEYRWVLDAGRPRFAPDGTWVGYIGSVIDIHERIQAEEQLRVFAGRLESLVDERTHALVKSHERLRALATELNLAELRERKRLATELHDYLQQILVLAKLKVGQQKRRAPQAMNGPLLEELDTLLSDALKYTRSLVADLSPPVLRDHGLVASLRWLIEYMTKYDLRVTVEGPDREATPIPDDQSSLLFQSVRELLINTSKHAGTLDAHVVVEEQNGWISIEVRDQGVGFDERALTAETSDHGTLSSKFGLLSIRERMRALGGAFEIRSSPGLGTTAFLHLPVTATAVFHADSAVAMQRDSSPSPEEGGSAPA
jgi:PAS domain S-box-containing protein